MITDKDITQSALYQSIRPQIRRLMHKMEQKFRLHDEERGDPFRPFDNWEQFLEKRLVEETKELDLAWEQKRPPDEIWKETADVCNIRLMRAINYEREYWQTIRERQKGQVKKG